uniref:Acyloxyacyl hydrolase-like n=1 Tax=Saccoglossus kowalevskii TaxID=10224 RepID=A0ABM0MAB1_SACKO|nr:PREDICTED: acyloxyacyl hydrolase-like [Saccoglossus kowalevskii]
MDFKFLVFVLLLSNSVAAFYKSTNRSLKDVNGGTDCAACTIIVSLIDQLSLVYSESIDQAMQRLCGYLPDQYNTVCKEFIYVAGPIIVDLLANGESPDAVCHALTFCTTDPPNPPCKLYPQPRGGLEAGIKRSKLRAMKYTSNLRELLVNSDICNMLPGLKQICEMIEGKLNNHEPVLDIDKDGFSIIDSLRGSSWRGKDCDDSRAAVHPGARPVDWDRYEDSNCNGIYGVDPVSGKPYEQLFCGDSKPMGVGLLGDSAGAHFHIPAEWVTPTVMGLDMFANITFVAGNELDWPSMSGTTGYQNLTWPTVHGWTDSAYLRLRQRNLCNHRDYQNIAVNGGDSGNTNDNAKSLSRNQTSDYPMILFYSLIGNDVCNGHPDTIEHMTTPEVMKANVIDTLAYLDTVLPAGSALIMTGLADGRVLWKYMNSRYHPLGELRGDVTYADLYAYLMCLQVSPCNGWMSSNETLRNFTSERAAALSKVLQDLASTRTYKNYKIHYMDFALHTVIDEWVAQGGKPWDLIEPVDGFHPSQISQALTAAYTWTHLMQNFPEVLGKENPHNEQIRQLFGDQGGH